MAISISKISNWLFTPLYILNQGPQSSGQTKDVAPSTEFFQRLNYGEYIGFGTLLGGAITKLIGRARDNEIVKKIGNLFGYIGAILLAGGVISGFIKNKKYERELNSTDLPTKGADRTDVNDKDPIQQGEFSPVDSLNITERPQAAYQAKMSVESEALDRWVSWRILVDTIQNHVDETRIQKANLWRAGKKEEAKALRADIGFVLKDGRKISFYENGFQDVDPDNVKDVVISDHGDGYDKERLEWVWSSKTDEDLKPYEEMGINPPGGKFGEGLKMVPASILKIQKEQTEEKTPEDKRLGLSFRSQNWEARLIEKEIKTKSGKSTFGVDYELTENGYDTKGSQTIIHNPTLEMINHIKDAGNLCLDFASPQSIVASSSKGKAYENGLAKLIFVRGYRVISCDDLLRAENSALFSYDLKDVDIFRDRDKLEEWEVKKEIGSLLLNGSSKETIKKLLKRASKRSYAYKASDKDSGHSSTYDLELEFQALNLKCEWQEIRYESDEKSKTKWREAFYETYGKDAILCSSSDFSNDSSRQAKAKGKNLVVSNLPLFRVLKECGVETDFSYSRTTIEDYKLGLSLEHRKDRWGPIRIVLDSLQNHADAARKAIDLGQNDAHAEVEILIGNKWLSLSNIDKYQNDQINGVRFKDNSKTGYSHGHLAQFGSTKAQSNSLQIGEFGEGLKIASAACIRLGLDVTCRSQDWIAEGFSYENVIKDSDDSQELHRNLGYHVYRNPRQLGSETIIKPPEKSKNDSRKNLNEVLNVLRNLKYFVLRHRECGLSESDPVPLFINDSGDIVSSSQGDIYVKDFYITSEERQRLIFGYNFRDLKINVDRDIPSQNDLIKEVGEVISGFDRKDLIKIVIQRAVEEPYGKYHEFQNLSLRNNFRLNYSFWREAFKDLYGNKAVLGTGRDDSDNEATWMGFKVIKVNSEIAKTLHSAGVLSASDAIQAEYPYLEESKLTESEKAVLDFARHLDENEVIFPRSDVETEYKVFEVAKNKVTGEDMAGILGCCDISGRKEIGFKRSVLHNPVEFFETYLEEKAHQLSGAPDGHRLHFNKALDSTMWTIFTDRAKQVLEKIKEVFTGFDISKVQIVYDDKEQRARLVYAAAT